ncbi:hypothetical protein DN820_02470 [Stutzerimonas nosocomialis]|uniref:Glycine zipper family protein n=1 Tax=Stutzerimonas nosocomialis TaxID=1056496 RepID=A0A5R9QIR6_9GAMM|nr:hypothetical protein [Stutzerimonas nosocomialis]TLX65194.1 hypothetical protein DN820_02470 [Stutzerimonas nosocomialis]
MRSSYARVLLAGLLAFAVTTPALAGPHGPGRFDHHGKGPRHGHGLPPMAREIWVGNTLYFVAADRYYRWSARRREYVRVSPPPAVRTVAMAGYDVIAYPTRGQSADRQARDRYECHRWAVNQSGFDPAGANSAPARRVADTYRRALGACLGGRGYSVN